MRASRLLILLALPAAALPLGGCASDGYGYGYGYGYDAYDRDWGDPYWGWYGDYYYPGVGIYVYDSQRRRHRWNDGQRRYWESRRSHWRGPHGASRSNWGDFRRRGDHRRGDGGRRGDHRRDRDHRGDRVRPQ